jgi:hypothetical protein
MRPDPEVIVEHAVKVKDRKKLGNWYPAVVGTLPLSVARYICQRTNVWWDARLRRRYADTIMGTMWVAIALCLAFAIWHGMTMEGFILSVLAPLSPLILWSIRESKRQSATIVRTDQVKREIDETWTRILRGGISDEDLERRSRHLQDEMYDRRKGSSQIPNWLYGLLRDKYEDQAARGAEQLIAEFAAAKKDS